MNTKLNLSIAAAALSIASFSVPAVAGGISEDTHAFLKAERAITEGQSDGIFPVPKHAVAKRTSQDKWFAVQRARTEGQGVAVRAESQGVEEIGAAARSWLDFQRTRMDG